MTVGDARHDLARTLGEVLALVFKAVSVVEAGLLLAPTVEEERILNLGLQDLRHTGAMIRAKLDGVSASTAQVTGPTSAQLSEILHLAIEVDASSKSASAAIVFKSKVLGATSRIVASSGGPHGGGQGSDA